MKVQRENGVAFVDTGPRNVLVCFSCGKGKEASGKEVSLELDPRPTPPELVCGKCRRKLHLRSVQEAMPQRRVPARRQVPVLEV